MKEKLAIVIAALMVTSMVTAISTTTVGTMSTFSVSSSATVSPTSARANARIKFTVNVTNGYATDNIDNVIIKATSAFTQPIGYWENLVLAADNMENAVPYLQQAGENLKLAEDNKKSAGSNIQAAGDALAAITQGDWLAENITAGSGTADENAYVNVSNAASMLKLVADAIDNSIENLDYIYTKLYSAGNYLKLAAAVGSSPKENIENIRDDLGENIDNAGADLCIAAQYLVDGDLESAGLALQAAAENLSYAGGDFTDPELSTYFQTAGSQLNTAGQKLIDAGNFLDNAGYALGVAENYLNSAGGLLVNHLILGTAGANLKIAASLIENAGTAIQDNVLRAGENLKLASDNLENVAAELGVDLGKDEISAAATDLDQAGDNLKTSGRVDMTTAGNELISAATNLSAGAVKMKTTASALAPATWNLTAGTDYVEFDAIGDNVITPGNSTTFVFLMTTPNITTKTDYTISVLVSKEETTYTAYENLGGFTLTVDGAVPTLTITVTQAGVAVSNVVGNKLNGGQATITVVASETLQSIGTAIVENSGGSNENLLPPITLTSTDGINYTGTFTVGEWDDNSCQVRITSAKDLAGNENTSGMVGSFTVDTRAPILDTGLDAILSGMRQNVVQAGTGTVYGYVENATPTKNVIVTVRDNVTAGTANENTRVISVVVGNTVMTRDPMVENRWTKTITLSEGYNSIVKVTATDWTGNSVSDNVENIFVDTHAPTITFNTIAGKTWTSGVYINDNTPEIKLTITDPGYPTSGLGIALDNLIVQLDNDDNIWNGTPYWTLDNKGAWDFGLVGVFENIIDNARPENTYYINVWASDNLWHAGENGVVDSRSFIVDVTAPSAPASLVGTVTAGTVASPTATRASSISLTGTGEANATVKVYTTTNAGVTWTEYTAGRATVSTTGAWTTSVQLTGFAGETLGIAVTVTDAAGNESSRTLYGYLIYDASAPTVTITSPADGTSTDQASIQVTGTVTKDSWESYSGITLTLQVGVGSVSVPIGSDGSFVYSVALSEGLNTIVARASDGVNVGAPATVTVTRTVTPWATYAIIIVIIALILAAIAIFRRR